LRSSSRINGAFHGARGCAGRALVNRAARASRPYGLRSHRARFYGTPRRGQSVPRDAEDGVAMLTLLRLPF
jgi:hypothetical protein